MPLIFPDTQTNEEISHTSLYLWTEGNAAMLHSKINLKSVYRDYRIVRYLLKIRNQKR
ncbi:MAG: hypothetical protein HYZ10_07100 [Ignavibacteriales bacterium]|nr:hypothetical protein [Ignavibacteriales bacterium]